MHFFMRFLLVASLTGALAACGAPEPESGNAAPDAAAEPATEPAPEPPAEPSPVVNPEPPEDDEGLADTSWVATEIDGQATADGVESTLAFEGLEKVTGSAGCNRYFGPATVDGQQLQFGNLATTMMACPEHISAQELKFLQAMGQVRAWTREGDNLNLADESGNALLRLSRVVVAPMPEEESTETPADQAPEADSSG